jgi:hypothetical protein
MSCKIQKYKVYNDVKEMTRETDKMQKLLIPKPLTTTIQALSLWTAPPSIAQLLPPFDPASSSAFRRHTRATLHQIVHSNCYQSSSQASIIQCSLGTVLTNFPLIYSYVSDYSSIRSTIPMHSVLHPSTDVNCSSSVASFVNLNWTSRSCGRMSTSNR